MNTVFVFCRYRILSFFAHEKGKPGSWISVRLIGWILSIPKSQINIWGHIPFVPKGIEIFVNWWELRKMIFIIYFISMWSEKPYLKLKSYRLLQASTSFYENVIHCNYNLWHELKPWDMVHQTSDSCWNIKGIKNSSNNISTNIKRHRT